MLKGPTAEVISESKLKKQIAGRKLLIDSNIIIYLTDSIQPYATLARSVFSMVESGDAQAVISILSIGEVMQGPLRKGQKSVALDVRDYLMNFPNCHCQEITTTILEQVGNDHRIKWKGLRTMDSLIIASGLANAVDIYVSNDKHFKASIKKELLLSFEP